MNTESISSSPVLLFRHEMGGGVARGEYAQEYTVALYHRILNIRK